MTSNATNLVVFQFQGTAVRTVTENGIIHFVGKDVCERLGYKDATTAIRSHCRGVQKLHPIIDSLGRPQNVRVLSEADVMRLICGSQLKEAVEFERWIFEEVLPVIRKTGNYATQPELPPAERTLYPTWQVAELLGISCDYLRTTLHRHRPEFIDGVDFIPAAEAPLMPSPSGKFSRGNLYTESGCEKMRKLLHRIPCAATAPLPQLPPPACPFLPAEWQLARHPEAYRLFALYLYNRFARALSDQLLDTESRAAFEAARTVFAARSLAANLTPPASEEEVLSEIMNLPESCFAGNKPKFKITLEV